jgi:hypothetical protein
MVLGELSAGLLTPCCRLPDFLATPRDVPFLAKLLQREIIYRLLQGTQGDRLRSVVSRGDQSNNAPRPFDGCANTSRSRCMLMNSQAWRA